MTDRRMFLMQAAAAAMVLGSHASVAGPKTRSVRIRTADSTDLYVKVWGETGRPVILTHAWPLSADIWDVQANALAALGYRVVAYDRRGFGRSGKPASGYNFDTFADDLATVIKDLDLRDAALFGYSMGGG